MKISHTCDMVRITDAVTDEWKDNFFGIAN